MSPRQSDSKKGASRKVLGRGLGALIPVRDESATTRGATTVPVAMIEPNPFQPRRAFDDHSIRDLASSIREHGIIQPLIVARSPHGYQLIAGERRLRAARILGLEHVPVVVRDETPDEMLLEIALIENIQREDLNPIEEARAYEQLHNQFGLTQAEIAQKVGRERSTITNTLRLLKLPASIQSMLAGGEISMGHARPLLALERDKDRIRLAERIVRDGLSARQVEAIVSGGPRPGRTKQSKPKDVFTRDAEEKLARALRTRVEIERRKKGGIIRVAFSSEDELIRLFEDLAGNRRKR